MLTDSIERTDVTNEKALLSSPVDSPSGNGVMDATCGLSATTSESSSQPCSWTSRTDSPGAKGCRGGDGTGGLSSYMPIVDEEDCPGRDGQTTTSEDEQQPTSPSAQADAFHKAAYERQVRLWQQVETFYMKHEDWSEHRVILLLQEAFRASYLNLKRSRDAGVVSPQVFEARAAELRTSLLAIKKEYRRTLQRTKERHGDLAGIASKAVTCVASVYPWSSEGFVLGFEENLRYGELAGGVGASARRAAPPIAPAPSSSAAVVVVPPSATAAVPMPPLEADADEGDDLSLGDSAVAGGRSRRAVTPRIALRPLPPRRQLFQPSAPATEAVTAVECVTAPLLVVCPPSESPTRTTGVSSPLATAPRSPTPMPPTAVAGPLRPGESRFFEKRQLVVHGMAFASRSLASTSFIASRRAAIAAATMRLRLGLAREKDEGPSLVPQSPSRTSRARPQPAPAQPPCPATSVPTLPTRFLTDMSPTPSEAAAFDSNPNSMTHRSNQSSVTKRSVVAAAPAAPAAPYSGVEVPAPSTATTAAARSLPGSVTKRAMGNNSFGHAAPSNPPSFDTAVPVATRAQPHSYTSRRSSSNITSANMNNGSGGPGVVMMAAPGQPHSYTSRNVALQQIHNAVHYNAAAPVMCVPSAYGVTPCGNYCVDQGDRLPPRPAGLPAYGQALPSNTPPVNVYAAPTAVTMPAAPQVLAPSPAPPPGYTSHVRRDRLRAPPTGFAPPYSGLPPVSVEDEQHVKELW